jgi:unsaturated chondroitin disaccharide hydrolase
MSITQTPTADPHHTRAELNAALETALAKIDANITTFADRYPAPATINGTYPLIDNIDWTAAFWPGQLWLAYEITGHPRYLAAARSHLASFDRRIRQNIEVNHHDIGFLYTLSTVPAWKLTGDLDARATALHAADCLLARYKPLGRFIQAWQDLDDPKENRLIIDSLMNLPLLHWAARETTHPRYREAAENHLHTLLSCIIRPDDSTCHTYYFDPATGAPLRGVTHQGRSDDSCWSRGQAWAVYGLALARRHVDYPVIMPAHHRVTDYFLKRLPADSVCYWDLVFTEGPEPRDSSAAAIAVCGLLEACRHLHPGSRRDEYETAAHTILRSLAENYAATPAQDGLLLHGVYSKPHNHGVDECCNWGDYFYLEALIRLLKDWDPYW